MRISSVEDTYFPFNSHLRLNDNLMDMSSPKVMGILNLTDDSFYEPSRIVSDKQLIEKVCQMIEEGADIIDLGAYSSRPGALDIPLEIEQSKIKKAVTVIRNEFKDIILSIDTFRSNTARSGIEAGADIINDISGGQLDDKMFDTVGQLKVPYILMHMRGTPAAMQDQVNYTNLFNDLIRYFSERTSQLKNYGVKDIIIDPGFGFSKTLDQNYQLLHSLNQFKILGHPILVGVSRKSMIYKKLDITPETALNGTTVLNTIALLKGANILRVHDVKEAKQIIQLLS